MHVSASSAAQIQEAFISSRLPLSLPLPLSLSLCTLTVCVAGQFHTYRRREGKAECKTLPTRKWCISPTPTYVCGKASDRYASLFLHSAVCRHSCCVFARESAIFLPQGRVLKDAPDGSWSQGYLCVYTANSAPERCARRNAHAHWFNEIAL